MDIAKYIEYTNLSPTATKTDIKKLCIEAKKYGFYAVCVTSSYVRLAKKFLSNSPVKLISVVGFPHGTSKSKIKANESRIAVKDGADEIDMVMNIGALKSKDYTEVLKDIREVVQAVRGKTVKVILEVGYLTKDEIKKACELIKKSGAHFVKTSTGYGPRKTKLSDVSLIYTIVKNSVKIKASGGIRDYKTAVSMIKAGSDRVGSSYGVKIIQQQKRIKI